MTSEVRLADVAKAAGVSLATASRALNRVPGRRVGADLRARVLAAAAELDYSPNANAQAMARGTTDTVGLIVNDIADPYAAAIAAGVMEAAAARGLIVTVAATGWNPETEVRHVEALRRQRARAVILAGSRYLDAPTERQLAAEVAGIQKAGGHVAVIGQRVLPVSTLVLANAAGARRLARVLWTLYYRRFAVLAGPENVLTSEERVAGFRDGLADCGYRLPPENVVSTQLTRDGGYVAMTELLELGTPVDVVFAVNDVMAVGAMAALREHGHRVPQDMALAGFDDIITLRDIQPPLTTVRIPLVKVGQRALETALDGSRQGAPPAVTINGEVVVRASTPERPRPRR